MMYVVFIMSGVGNTSLTNHVPFGSFNMVRLNAHLANNEALKRYPLAAGIGMDNGTVDPTAKLYA